MTITDAASTTFEQRFAMQEEKLERLAGLLSASVVSPSEVGVEVQRLLTEVAGLQAQVARCDRECAEFDALQREESEALALAERDLIESRAQLAAAHAQRNNTEEYETLARAIRSLPSRATSQREIDALRADLDALRAQESAAAEQLVARRRQFALLFHALHQLHENWELGDDDRDDGDDDSRRSSLSASPALDGADPEEVDMDGAHAEASTSEADNQTHNHRQDYATHARGSDDGNGADDDEDMER